MPLYYGIILPKELFWTTLAEDYIKKNRNEKSLLLDQREKRTFDNPISQFLYSLVEEFGDSEHKLNDEDINDIEKNALKILDNDEWNFDEVIFEGIYHIKFPKDFRFLGDKVNIDEDAFYILDNVEFDIIEIDGILKDKGFKDFKPQLCFCGLTLYGGEKLKLVKGLNIKNKI